MKKPKIELKNVKHFEGHDGMTGLNADIYINGVKCLHVHDAAFGGCFDYYDYAHNSKDPEKVKSLIKEFDTYLATLPEETVYINDDPKRPFNIKMDRDWMVSKLEGEWAKKRMEAKMKKQMITKILVGVPDGETYSYYDFKKPLSSFATLPLQNAVNRIKAQLKKDEVILNTNLQALGVTF